MSTPANSNVPSESSRIQIGFNESFDDDNDVVMAELQPQARPSHVNPSDGELRRWYEDGG